MGATNRLPARLPLAFLILSSFHPFTTNVANALTLAVTECDDGSSPGTLRNTIASAPDNSIIQIPLKCSKITLTQGSIKVPGTLTNVYIAGQGASQTVLDGGLYNEPSIYDRVFRSYNPGILNLSDLTVTNGAYSGSDNHGGCILAKGSVGLDNAVVTHCQILPQGNGAPRGGGIYAVGSVSLVNSQVTRNYAIAAPGQTSQGGGIYAATGVSALSSTISGNVAFHGLGGSNSNGGGFYSRALGALQILKSTISGNVADRNSAFQVGELFGYTGSLNIVSSTIADNIAADVQTATSYVPTTVTDSTIAYNRVERSYIDEPAGLYSTKSIVANNSVFASNSAAEGSAIDVSSGTAAITGSHDLIVATPDSVPAGTISACPRLGHLSNNGGPTQTTPLLKGSPAIDVGAANGQSTDQRGTGFPRTVGAAADIGAYERQTGVIDDVIFFSEFDSRCN